MEGCMSGLGLRGNSFTLKKLKNGGILLFNIKYLIAERETFIENKTKFEIGYM